MRIILHDSRPGRTIRRMDNVYQGPGRPEVAPDERRSERIGLSFKPAEWSALAKAAARKGQKPGQWIRALALRAAGVRS
jgi:hypothetical protein